MAIFMSQIMSYMPEAYSHYYFDSEYGEGSVRIASIVDFIFNLSFYILVAWKTPFIWNKQKEFQILFLMLVGISFLGLKGYSSEYIHPQLALWRLLIQIPLHILIVLEELG